MAKIDARHVMAIRRLTDLPVMQCRDALARVDGDLAALLRQMCEYPPCGPFHLTQAQVTELLTEFGIPVSAVARTPKPVS